LIIGSPTAIQIGEVVYICIAVGDPIIMGRLFISVLLLEIQLSWGGCLYLYYWISNSNTDINNLTLIIESPTAIQI
jgi:hypothetical protein